MVDWDCEVHTLFREENLGCGRGVSGAISWFFEHEEAGIILEDDIRPEASFFPFVTELLHRYADDPRVWAVSGCNFVPPEYHDRQRELQVLDRAAHLGVGNVATDLGEVPVGHPRLESRSAPTGTLEGC